jgi:tetratricopeptide (TPR) repeat protein
MSTADLDALRKRADPLDVGEEALALYTEILELDPDDTAAANMIGRSLQALDRIDEAREHWQFIAELQPGNEIARSRVRSLKPVEESVQVTSSRPTKPRRAPSDVVEPILAGPGRDGALRFLARSIRLIEKIDPARVSVTTQAPDARLRVYGGRDPAVTPTRGLLLIWIHAPAVTPELAAAMGAIDGAQSTAADGLALLPDSVEYRVPFAHIDAVSDLLAGPHREHLLRAIAEGAPPRALPHDSKLRDYIVNQAAVTSPAGVPRSADGVPAP